MYTININIFHFIWLIVKVADAGKYMVKATNAGGEAQSIADFAVIEPTPDRMVEVVKTVVFENVQNQKVHFIFLQKVGFILFAFTFTFLL